jgi:hypothetical protein
MLRTPRSTIPLPRFLVVPLCLHRHSASFSDPSLLLVAILVTSGDAIDVEESPTQLYSLTRRADLLRQWQLAFPRAVVVMDRLETPRDCVRVAAVATSSSESSRSSSASTLVLHRLDAQGPFGWNSETMEWDELGKPLRTQPWDWNTEQIFGKEH